MSYADEKLIDYHVTYPNQSSKLVEPVVVLLGWTGSSDKNLAKYAEIYKERAITIRYISPAEDLFFRTENLRASAKKILDLIISLHLQNRPIFVHIFSNGGGNIYRYITELLHNRPEFTEIQLRGSIFDSCPSPRNLKRGLRVYMMISSGNMLMKYLKTFLVFLYMLFLNFWNIMTRKSKSAGHVYNYMVALLKDPARCPQLYLYSKADTLIGYKDVESHIVGREALGVKVFKVCWENSAHVAHLMMHRDVYIKSCLDFIEFCLS